MLRPRRRLVALLALLSLAVPATAHARRRRGAGGARKARGALVLDGQEVRVRWIDGDTFAVEDGPLARVHARVVGVNALETFGPVHAWGGWAPGELLELARATSGAAARGRWGCAAAGRDRYGRMLATCPELALALVRAGLAMVFAVDAAPDPALLAAQQDAQRGGAGMWAKGVPPVIVASAHSADEPGLGRQGAYDRLVDTRTGVASARPHHRTYAACEPVCVGEGSGRSCFVYVPYPRRFRDRPACLLGKRE
jgi:endonuclease YncB( thermonuclease family)